MADSDFGEWMSEDEIYQMLADLFERAPKLAQSQADIVLRDQYEDAFRIRRPGMAAARHDLLSIEMMPSEDPVWGSVLREHLEVFAIKEIGRIFHISFDAYLRLPCYYADELAQVATMRLEEEGTKQALTERQLRDILGQSQQPKS